MKNKNKKPLRMYPDGGMLNFEQRIQNPEKFIENPDGGISSHEMLSWDDDKGFHAAPTIIQLPSGELQRLHPHDAIKYAQSSGQYKTFKTQGEANAYADNGYKKNTPIDSFEYMGRNTAGPLVDKTPYAGNEYQYANGGFINNDMKNKNKKPLPTYGLGGDLLQTGLNGLKFVGNNAVQMAGGNRPFDYTGAGRHEFDKIDNVASPIFGTMSKALPMAANMVVPGSGAAISLAQQGIGAATDGLQVRAEGGYNNGRVNLNAFVAGAPLLSNFPQHAMGGQMQDPTNSNMLTNFPTGGTHEQNPMGGVNVGNRGLVEQGETKAPLDKGDYIFSDRLKPKGNNRTFAQLSKSIHNKYKDRENDAAATRSMKADLEKLAQEQEAFKAAKQAKMQGSMDALSNMGDGDMFMSGGKLKPYSKFMFPDGGFLQSKFGPVNTDNDPNEVAFNQEFPGETYNTFNPLTGVGTPQVSTAQEPMYSQSDALGLTKQITPQYGNSTIPQNNSIAYNKYNVEDDPSNTGYTFKNDMTDLGNQAVVDVTNKGNAAIANNFKNPNSGYPAQKADPWIPLAQSAGDIFALAKSQKPQKDIKLARYSPEMIDYSREREIASKQANMANQIAQANIRRNASSSGQALSNTVASNAINNSALMNTLSQSNQAQENINNQMRNQAMLTNNATSNQEQELNMKNKAQLAFMQQQALSNIGANTANFGVDQRKINAQNNTNAIMEKLMNQPDFLANLDPKDRAEFIYTYNQNRIKGQ